MAGTRRLPRLPSFQDDEDDGDGDDGDDDDEAVGWGQTNKHIGRGSRVLTELVFA